MAWEFKNTNVRINTVKISHMSWQKTNWRIYVWCSGNTLHSYYRRFLVKTSNVSLCFVIRCMVNLVDFDYPRLGFENTYGQSWIFPIMIKRDYFKKIRSKYWKSNSWCTRPIKHLLIICHHAVLDVPRLVHAQFLAYFVPFHTLSCKKSTTFNKFEEFSCATQGPKWHFSGFRLL